ncbi:hypothetical protein D3C78_1648180 [compost metagenome]
MQTFLEVHAKALKTFAGSVHVRHRHTEVAKATRLTVAVVVMKISLLLGAMVMGELQNTRLTQDPAFTGIVILWDLVARAAGQVANGKRGFIEGFQIHRGKAQHAGIKVQRLC